MNVIKYLLVGLAGVIVGGLAVVYAILCWFDKHWRGMWR